LGFDAAVVTYENSQYAMGLKLIQVDAKRGACDAEPDAYGDDSNGSYGGECPAAMESQEMQCAAGEMVVGLRMADSGDGVTSITIICAASDARAMRRQRCMGG